MRPARLFITTVIGFLTLLLLFLNSKSSVDFTGNFLDETQEGSTEDTENFQTVRYVTPSLAQLGGRGAQARMNKHMLMLTRIPDAGAEVLVLILQRLQGYNAFKHIRLPPGDGGLLSTLQQELLVEEITSIVRQEAIPLSFDGDVRFLNFSAFGRQAPTYLSLVRNPLDFRASRRSKELGGRNGAVAHFCGQSKMCTERTNGWALEKAKENILEWYPVVGLLDHMEETLLVLEKNFPYFFKGATGLYESIRGRKIPLKNRDEETWPKLLADEIELYRWLKSRLLEQAIGK